MSDKAILTHRLQTENSSSIEKSLKEEVNHSLYNYNLSFYLIFRQIKSLKIKIVIKQHIKYQIQIQIIIE